MITNDDVTAAMRIDDTRLCLRADGGNGTAAACKAHVAKPTHTATRKEQRHHDKVISSTGQRRQWLLGILNAPKNHVLNFT